jgi:hypothetical protein
MTKCPQWDVQFNLDADLCYHSYTLVGLQELAREGVVALKQSGAPRAPRCGRLPNPFVLTLAVRPCGSKRWISVAYDLSDHNSVFCYPTLAQCDLYFKANYHPASVQQLTDEWSRRVHPGGVHLGVRPCASLLTLGSKALWAASTFLVSGSHISLRARLRRAIYVSHSLISGYKNRATVEEYESLRKTTPRQGQVFFNGTCWQPDEEREACDTRAQVVRLARSNPTCVFIGGLRPNALARAQYPELLFEPDPTHRQYLEFVAQSEVVIGTLGVGNCFSWKLTEYLAAGKCILSEQPINELPVPLRDGEEIAYFKHDLSDFQDRLTELMTNPDLRRHLADGARRYYDQWVKPRAAMRWLLERTTSLMEGGELCRCH